MKPRRRKVIASLRTTLVRHHRLHSLVFFYEGADCHRISSFPREVGPLLLFRLFKACQLGLGSFSQNPQCASSAIRRSHLAPPFWSWVTVKPSSRQSPPPHIRYESCRSVLRGGGGSKKDSVPVVFFLPHRDPCP